MRSASSTRALTASRASTAALCAASTGAACKRATIPCSVDVVLAQVSVYRASLALLPPCHPSFIHPPHAAYARHMPIKPRPTHAS
uniref:Expressed protein n=1 Tax=Schizophyllum commune (strain H4-8 / FGSC 9210) TaxID=578458 RepID=D8QJC0_SCHCM